MTQATHNDMMRDFGRMETQLVALKEGVDRIEKGVDKIDQRLTLLEAKENQRKGALAFLMILAGAVGGGLVKFVSLFVGSTH